MDILQRFHDELHLWTNCCRIGRDGWRSANCSAMHESPLTAPTPLVLSFYLSVFLSVFLSPSFWWQPSLMKSLHGIISTTSLHIFSMGGSSGKKKKYFRHWHQSRILPTELVPNRGKVAAGKRLLLNVNVIFQSAAWSETSYVSVVR